MILKTRFYKYFSFLSDDVEVDIDEYIGRKTFFGIFFKAAAAAANDMPNAELKHRVTMTSFYITWL